MQRIEFRSPIGVEDMITDGLDKDYYLYELEADDFQMKLVNEFVTVDAEFSIEFDDDISFDEMWDRITMEFDRPELIGHITGQ
jgi:hypothetical protein